MSECSVSSHEQDKQSPAALAEHYDAHAELWVLDDAVMEMYTCRRCHSTVCVLVQP